MFNKHVFIFLFLCISGCGIVKPGTYKTIEDAKTEDEVSLLVIPDDLEFAEATFVQANKPASVREIQGFLELAYEDWQGIPYQWGGEGYYGIDCSAFMQIVYEDYFSQIIPRTTVQQLQLGSTVRRNASKPGDMVFFKTGRRTYHVGIMIDEVKFLHASSSKGVKVSSLQQDYWSDKYLVTRRIL